MLTCRSPFRISYFGGGTDFPEWYTQNDKGFVISTTIDKYCYVLLRTLPPFFSFNYRLRYFNTETVKKINQIKHPTIKNILQKYHLSKNGLEIIHYADLPALSGLGASSSFTNCLLSSIHKYNKIEISKKTLAQKSVFVEKNLLGENCGLQDQYASAYGGFNQIIFKKNNISIKQMLISKEKKKILENNTLIFFTGISRKANNIEKNKIKTLNKNIIYYEQIYDLAKEAKEIFLRKNNESFLKYIAELLNESWKLKKELSSDVSNDYINNIYNFGLKNGAIAGKILGAGGGGFIMFLTKNSSQKRKLVKSLSKFINVDFKFEDDGTRIINNKLDDYK